MGRCCQSEFPLPEARLAVRDLGVCTTVTWRKPFLLKHRRQIRRSLLIIAHSPPILLCDCGLRSSRIVARQAEQEGRKASKWTRLREKETIPKGAPPAFNMKDGSQNASSAMGRHPRGKQEKSHFLLCLVKLRFRCADGAVQQMCNFLVLVPLNLMKAKDSSAAWRKA
jgi:hypothetical protein